MVKVTFLGNVTVDQDGRPACARFDDTPYREGDRLVEVWQGEIDAAPEDPFLAAEILYGLMNRDERPTGQYFRSMSIGDVALVHLHEGDNYDVLVCKATGFDRVSGAPIEYESGLTREQILAALRGER